MIIKTWLVAMLCAAGTTGAWGATATVVRIDLTNVRFSYIMPLEDFGTDSGFIGTYAVTGSLTTSVRFGDIEFEGAPRFVGDGAVEVLSDGHARFGPFDYGMTADAASVIFLEDDALIASGILLIAPDPSIDLADAFFLEDVGPDAEGLRVLDLLFDPDITDRLLGVSIGDTFEEPVLFGAEDRVVEDDFYLTSIDKIGVSNPEGLLSFGPDILFPTRRNSVTFTVLATDATPVPLPAGGLLLAGGLVALAGLRRRA